MSVSNWSNRKISFKPNLSLKSERIPKHKPVSESLYYAGACSTVLVITNLGVSSSIANMRYIFARSCNHKFFSYPYKIYKSGVPLCLCLTVGSLGINFLRKAKLKEKENTFTSCRSRTE